MITRIVKLDVQYDFIQSFLEEVEKMKSVVRSKKGCVSLEILNSLENKNLFVTISEWEKESYLELYRGSNDFKTFWAKVKPMFNSKASAKTLFG